MKAIVNRKTYDTATAVAKSKKFQLDGSEVTVYRKRDGELFLAGEGGPVRLKGACNGHRFKTVAFIVPLTLAEAHEFFPDIPGIKKFPG